MGVSEFSSVSAQNADRLARSLDRRSTAALYVPYRTDLVEIISRSSGTIVDVGAGGGHLVERLTRAFPRRRVLGIEPSYELSANAAAHTRRIIVADGAALPLADATVGCVVAERVLQHVYEVAPVLAEMVRVTAAGGTIVCVDPVHHAVELIVPGLQQLANRLIRWRASAGIATPDAAEIAARYLNGLGWSVTQTIYMCATHVYADARVVANFPEWARLAAAAGTPISADDIQAWERYWDALSSRTGVDTTWFTWPVAVTVASMRAEA